MTEGLYEGRKERKKDYVKEGKKEGKKEGRKEYVKCCRWYEYDVNINIQSVRMFQYNIFSQ
jgi:hypothetical protein